MNSPHIPVLLDPILDSLQNAKGTILDCTLGYGGHSKALLDQNPNIKIIACDRDDMALEFCKVKFKDYGDRIEIIKSKFSDILTKIDTTNLSGILADIGLSSLQLDLDTRGFSTSSTKLDMRMDTSSSFDATALVNSYSQNDLEDIFYRYAQLPNASSIAQKIIQARQKSKITTAKELSQIIGPAKLGNRSVSIATLVFQAIRIEVNKELDELEGLLNSIENLSPNKTLVHIITFHSLEDKIVKSRFKRWEASCICPAQAYKCTCGGDHQLGKIITKKPVIASKEEIKANSRSSCAKLRIFEIKRPL